MDDSSIAPVPLSYIAHMVFAYLMAVVLFVWLLIERRQRRRDRRHMDERVGRANRAAADEIARAGLRRMQTDEMRRIERRETIWQ